MKFLMYGAGSIGRGFIGPLFSQGGYEVVFVDIDRQIVDALNTRRAYHYKVAADPPYEVPVTGVRGVNGLDEQAVIAEIASCDMMAVSLGAGALQKVAPVIAAGFSQRMKQSGQPLNILICENLKDSAHLLRGWICDALPEGERSLVAQKCGLIETAIGRMVPVALSNSANPDDPLHVTVEEYGFLPVDRDAFVGEPPDIPGLVPYSPFAFYEERKLYLHNMGHAVCAYLGSLHGYSTIAQAVRDPYIRLIVQSAMTESAAMLSAKYNLQFARVFDHAEDLLQRFGNAALGDTNERVGRDPLRKLRAGDRLAGALRQCTEHGVHPVYIALGYAAALRSITSDKEQAAYVALDVGKLPAQLTEIVLALFTGLNKPVAELLQTTEHLKKEQRGDIV